MTSKDWEFLYRLDDAFSIGEKNFNGRIGRLNVGQGVFDKLKDLPKNEWIPSGSETGYLGKIWDTPIYLDESLQGRQVTLEPPDTSS